MLSEQDSQMKLMHYHCPHLRQDLLLLLYVTLAAFLLEGPAVLEDDDASVTQLARSTQRIEKEGRGSLTCCRVSHPGFPYTSGI